jgi:hypothetical protein
MNAPISRGLLRVSEYYDSREEEPDDERELIEMLEAGAFRPVAFSLSDVKITGVNSVLYSTLNPYDPREDAPAEEKAILRKRLKRDRGIVRGLLPRLRELIEDTDRDAEDVFQALRPYHLQAREVPMTPDDLPELEELCRLILKRGGSRQSDIQRVLLRIVGATAAPSSVSFLLDMLHYSKRGDQFGPERRKLALWGLARIAIFHDVSEAYEALREGMGDHRADVRLTAADLILGAYLA